MYGDIKTAKDRLKREAKPLKLSKGQLRALAVIAFLFLLGAMHADHQALMMGIN